MTTPEEILMQYLKGDKGKTLSERYAIIAAMEEYARKITLKSIEITTGLNYGSKQSMMYLKQAEQNIKYKK